MKDKILYLILGILIGAVITAGCFLVYSKTVGQSQMGGGMRELDGEMPEMPNMGERGEKGERGEFQNESDMKDVTTNETNTTTSEADA